MPNYFSVGVAVTSTAVTTTALTQQSPVYIVRHEYGNLVHNTVTVTDSAGSHIVTTTNFTHSPTRP